MNREHYPITLGCTPFFIDHASGHVHTSVKDMNQKTWIKLRQKLYGAQPLIALLSQNSPITGSVIASDVRLLLSKWSTFTEFDSLNEGHWLSIAFGRNGATVEARIPSSGPLFQIMGIAALLRVILEDDAIPIAYPEVKDNYDRTINYGSAAIWEIALPSNTLMFDGVKHQGGVFVKATDVWKIYYDSYADKFDRVLGQLSSGMRKQVRDFYDFVASGYTLSDSYYKIINSMMVNEEDKIAEKLYQISYRSYNSNANAFDILPRCPDQFMPTIEKYYSIEEIRDIFDKVNSKVIAKDIKKVSVDVINAFFNNSVSFENGSCINLLMHLRADEKVYANDVHPQILRMLSNGSIIVIDDGIVKRGSNFSVALAIGKEIGAI